MKSNGKKKSKGLRVNFAGVETRTKMDEGNYHSKVVDAEEQEGNAATYIKWTFEVLEDGKHKGRKLYYNTSLAPQALWNLRNLLETLGVETPDSEMDLDLESYRGLEIVLTVANESYEGKERPKVTDFTPVEGADVEDDEKTDDEEEETDDDEENEEDEEEVDEDEEEETDDEEEDKTKLSSAEIREMDVVELKDLVKQHALKVDVAKITKPGKLVSAVIDAMEAKGLLAG